MKCPFCNTKMKEEQTLYVCVDGDCFVHSLWKSEVEGMTNALSAAYQRGQEAMRERAVARMEEYFVNSEGVATTVRAIRALQPEPEQGKVS